VSDSGTKEQLKHFLIIDGKRVSERDLLAKVELIETLLSKNHQKITEEKE